MLRGAPASGKSTWIHENGLSPYTISSDAVRLLIATPVYDASGNLIIPQEHNSATWQLINKLIREKMERGDTVILDATCLKSEDMRSYKKMASDNRYIVYVVDFTDVPMQECLRRNAEREQPARVPDYVIESFYAKLPYQSVPNGYRVVSPDEAAQMFFTCEPYDMTGYRAVNFFGDIHGCYTALCAAMDEIGCTRDESGDPILRDDEAYIFCGDYVDRGIENAEALRFLMSIASRDNVMMLEGNHERWLDAWAHDRDVRSNTFRSKTAPELVGGNINKKDVSRFYRKLIPVAWLRCPGDVLAYACHGGVPKMPDPYMGISCSQLIRGVGRYEDADEINACWEATSGEDGIYMVHGHRTAEITDVHPSDHVFSLEGAVEHGGELRIARFEDGRAPYAVCVSNDVFNRVHMDVKLEDVSFEDAVANLRANPMIREKELGDGISSFNFSQEAFLKNAWDVQSIKARGLFLDMEGKHIQARSYDKFFNVGEKQNIEEAAASFTYPVVAYRKENGYLGICSSCGDGKLFFASKSTNRGDYAREFKSFALRKLAGNITRFAKYLEDNDATAVFEVIMPEFDRHIIEYSEPQIVLLDVIYNDFAYDHIEYEDLCRVAAKFKLDVKEQICRFDTKRQLIEWYAKVSSVGYVPEDGVQVEGYVLEDVCGNMIKIKCDWYRYWKVIRGMIHDVMRRGKSPRVSKLTSEHPEVEGFYEWLKGYIGEWKTDGNGFDPAVIDVRNAWEEHLGESEA